MVNKQLSDILIFLKEKINGKDFKLDYETNLFLEILERKKEDFNNFQAEIRMKWNDFNKKNQKRTIKKTFTTFFYENFDNFFSYFLQFFFGFSDNSLKLIIKEKISEKILSLEYHYLLSTEEMEYFSKISKELEGGFFNGFTFPTGYLYFLIRILGIVIRRTIQEKILILLDTVKVKKEKNGETIDFMIIIKDSKDTIFQTYYDMVLYYFLRPFKGIPEYYYETLLEGRKKLYQIALEEYPFAKDKLVDLLYYFYKKCILLQSFSPLLDFFNFVGSRVEDSIFSKIDIIKKGFLANLDDYNDSKKNVIIKFFNYLDKKSTLYSTFQANNLPSSRSQLNLFFLYMKYYFGSGLEALEVGDLLFLPEKFKSHLNNYNKNVEDVITANSINNIKEFLNYFSTLSNIENIDLFFHRLFSKNISELNYGFFKTFLKSFNTDFSIKLETENKILSENPENIPFSFEKLVDHICRILYVLIDKIFLRSNPSEASPNFIDPRSRYIGKNIALRVLELFFFQDLNYSDDVWPDYTISLNKDKLKKEMEKYDVIISDENFYSDEELIQIMITYNIQSFSDQPFFEEWLVNEIIIPLNKFFSYIMSDVSSFNEIEVYEKLRDYFISGHKDEKIIKDFKFVCQKIAPFWKKFE
ncbi:MAG: hypothetical protein ACFE8B_00910 [Candidatus Hermodarchaeota archaeon]